MNSKNSRRDRIGRTWPDFIAEFLIYRMNIKDWTHGKVSKWQPTLELFKWISGILGLFMIVTVIEYGYLFLADNPYTESVLMKCLKQFVFFEPKWNFFVGLLLVGLSRWYASTQKLMKQEPEFERMAADRTNTQKQLLLRLDDSEDDSIFKGTDEPRKLK